MALARFDLILLIATIVILIIDIILALCLRFVIPYYITHRNDYYPTGTKLSARKALVACPCLQGVVDPFSKETIVLKSKRSRRSADELPKNVCKYPLLVSLSSPIFIDDTQKKFACNGWIESRNQIVTTKSCVMEQSEWYALTVRSESEFWSFGGREHNVTDVIPNDIDGLVRLKVSPDFAQHLEPVLSSKRSWTRASVVGWDKNMYTGSIPSRSKYKTFDVEKLTVDYSEGVKIVRNTTECGVSSKPLVTSCNHLIGFEIRRNEECDGFVVPIHCSESVGTETNAC